MKFEVEHFDRNTDLIIKNLINQMKIYFTIGQVPIEWSDENETEHPRLSSPANPALSAARIGNRELILESSSESSELSDVNPTASRSRPRRSLVASNAKEHRQLSRVQSPPSEASATATAAPERAAAENEDELPMTVTVPGRRQEIAKRTGRKVQKPQVFKARQLAGRVDAILTELEHGTKDYFHPDGARVVQYAKNAYNYLHAHAGKLLHDVRSMLAEVEWKALADIPGALFKTNGVCIATSAERAAYNLFANLPENVVPVERLNEKA